MKFIYVMDPMCGWCYGFQPELDAFLNNYPSAEVEWVMGGLAPDTDQPMDESQRTAIASYWHEIEAKTQARFNHDFWSQNTPYRSTYPACRAVIAAEILKAGSSHAMVRAIQFAYYRQARNPSLVETLISCAGSIGLDEKPFSDALASDETKQRFQHHLYLSNKLQVRGFPALFVVAVGNQIHPLAQGYRQSSDLDRQLKRLLRADQSRLVENGRRDDSTGA